MEIISPADEAMLPDDGLRPKKRAGILAAFLNTTKSGVGVGILTLSYGFHFSGYVAGILTLAFACVGSIIAVNFLVATKTILQKRHPETLGRRPLTYPMMAEQLLGILGAKYAFAMLVVAQMGVCVAYLVFCASTLTLSSLGSFGGGYHWWLGVVSVLCLLLSCIRSMRFLSIVSGVGCAALIAGLYLISYYQFTHIPALSWSHELPMFRPRTYFLFFGMASLSFEGLAGSALQIEQSMKENKHYRTVVTTSTLLLGSICIAFAMSGFVAFGINIQPMILMNIPEQTPLHAVISVLLVTELVCTYPPVMYPIFAIFEQWCGSSKRIGTTFFYQRPHLFVCVGIRVVLVAITAWIAYFFEKNFNLYLALVGSLANASILYILPPILFLRAQACRLEGDGLPLDARQTVQACALILFGSVASVIGTVQASFHLLEGNIPLGGDAP